VFQCVTTLNGVRPSRSEPLGFRANLTDNHWRRWTQRLRVEEFLNIKRCNSTSIVIFPVRLKCSYFGSSTRNFRVIARNSSALLRLADINSPRKMYTLFGTRRAVPLLFGYLSFSVCTRLNYRGPIRGFRDTGYSRKNYRDTGY